jgi:hypothetical protein
VSVWTSTLQRTILTAAGLPFAKLKWKALDEIDAGICDGMTYAQVGFMARLGLGGQERGQEWLVI